MEQFQRAGRRIGTGSDSQTAPLKQQGKEAALDPLHHAFYARYLSAGDKAYAGGSKTRIAAGDRLVLLIGELQTNVNRRGFARYLAQKGRRHAESVLRALTTVGATQTASMLSAALAPTVSPSRLSVLDRRFSNSREDLPALTMRYMEKHGRD
jgi:hypothetical protein